MRIANPKEEFLVMIIESLGDKGQQTAHVHKITTVGMN